MWPSLDLHGLNDGSTPQQLYRVLLPGDWPFFDQEGQDGQAQEDASEFETNRVVLCMEANILPDNSPIRAEDSPGPGSVLSCKAYSDQRQGVSVMVAVHSLLSWKATCRTLKLRSPAMRWL